MVSDLVFYQLALIALVWLLVLLQYAWPSRCGAGGHRAAKPITTTRKRSRDPKPFAGFPQKPHCEACEQTAESRPQASCAPPPPIVSTRGRRRQVDTSDHFCPHAICAYHGWVGFGNLCANGHPSGRRWRQFYCLGCKGYFQETHGTPFQGKHVEPDKLVWAIGALAEGLGIRAVARVFAVDPNTVLVWLVEAAEHLQAFSRYVLPNVHVDQVQLDELFALLRAVKEGEITAAKAIKRLSRSPHWVWVAMEPVTKLVLTVDVGARTLTMAQCVVHHLVQVLAPDCMPLFLTDGFREYLAALVTHYGQWVQSERSQAKGPMPKPRWMPRPGLLYAQVIKTVCRRRLVRVHHRVVLGTLVAVNAGLAKHGWQINTSFIERLNLAFRQHVAAIGRRVNTLCKHEAGLRQQLALFQVYHNFVLPHTSLRQPLPQPEPTNGTGSAKQWRPCTPAMAAGLTDHVWSLRDVLLYRVPPWPQPQAV
jgi:IS1 family transposase